MHVYFIHSYDINRLTLDEIDIINKLPDEQKITKTVDMMKQKKKKLDIVWWSKYIETKDKVKFTHKCIDFQGICQHVNNAVQESELQAAFSEYKDYKNQFIADVIDAYYTNDDEPLPLDNKISTHSLNCNATMRKKIYECIIQKHVKEDELNNQNFIKIASALITKSYPQINIEQFQKITTKFQINGKMFVKGPQFKSSVKFAKVFEGIEGYKKKHLAQTYKQIKKHWFSLKFKSLADGSESKNENIHEETKTKDTTNHNNENTLVYNLGIRFYFWEPMKQHKHYIEAKYVNLKDEMLQNKVVDFDIKRWLYLENEVKGFLETDEVKSIKSNGYWKAIYYIDANSPFTAQHFTALKLYTDYTKECGLFCSTLRCSTSPLEKKEMIKKKKMIGEIANWAKLLSECVQCYGTKLQKKKYYRGLNNVFNFEIFAVRFNLPTSTTSNFNKAVEFSDGSGIVIELKKYRDRYDVYKLDCWKFSGFDERETLFFGGDTVLQISSIWQWYSKEWTSYKKYITP
eukprot:402141_1